MFVRTTKVKKGDKTYRYAQIVRAYRREDGKPRQKVIASLGRLSELEIENLKLALKAAKDGEYVVRLRSADGTPVVRASRDYLPIAVVLEMARRTGVADLLRELLDKTACTVATSQVILALVAHRLVAPGSKVAAVRWFERTALPHLLGTTAAELNNSRLHRALAELDKVRPQLQLGLAQRQRHTTEVGRAVFLDVSDTWFEGRGPTLAQRHKTKEGAYKKKIGIVLAVNRDGQPLRWQVVAGRRHDSKTMADMARQLRAIPWMADMTLVFDRAMGKQTHLQELSSAGIRFLTLLTKEAFAGYAGEDLYVPGLRQVDTDDENDEQAQAAAIHIMTAAGFKGLGRRMWAKDLGIRRHRKKRRSASLQPESASSQGGRARAPAALPRVARDMRLAGKLTEAKRESGQRYVDVAESMGITRGRMGHLRMLMRLRPEIRLVVREGGSWANLKQLETLAKLPEDQQSAAFEQYLLADEPPAEDPTPEPEYRYSDPPLRILLAFDPVVFTAARAKAARQERELRTDVDSLRRRVENGRTSERSATRQVDRLLMRHSLTDCYEITTSPSTITLRRREEAWLHKRATDGFRVFAVHPDVEATPEQVLELYSAKMAVEVDFHVIKSTVRIRPVHHNTDAKVRAHVDLCIMALAVERALSAALPEGLSAPAALEQLETVRLIDVAIASDVKSTRVLSRPTEEQRGVLRHLGMLDLVDQPLL